MEEIAKPYFDGRPNSYILTKALAESYVNKHCQIFGDENNNEKLSEKVAAKIVEQGGGGGNNKENSTSENAYDRQQSVAATAESNDVLKNNLKNSLVSSGSAEARSNKPFRTYVVRPSIVYNSKSEPTVGWIDSFNGPSGFSIFIFLGLIRYVQMSFDKVFQCVPVDYLANILISIPHLYTAVDQGESNENTKPKVEVITVTYDEVEGFEVLKRGFKYLQMYPSLYMLRVPEIPPYLQPKETVLLSLKRYLYEDLWAQAMDVLFLLIGLRSKISIVRLHKKYLHACSLMEYFIKHRFYFPTKNYKKLVKLQDETDAVLFDFNFQNYDVEQIASSYVLGTRRYLLNEPDSTISFASKKFRV